jgi:hypothetical protein
MKRQWAGGVAHLELVLTVFMARGYPRGEGAAASEGRVRWLWPLR